MWINWRLVGIWAACTILGVAVFSLAGCSKVKRGWSIEAPPPQYASGPTQTGQTNEIPNLTPELAHQMCVNAGTFSDKQQGYGVACYIPSLDAVVLPSAKTWPSSDELNQMRAHEWAHARGWRHTDDGTGTGVASLEPQAAADPSFAPADPANPSPAYRGPPLQSFGFAATAPVIPSAQQTAAVTPPVQPTVPPGLFGFSARKGQ